LHYSSSSTLTTFFFFHFSRHPLPLHSFPTRRSSDLSDALKILLSKINNDRIKVNKVRPYVNHRIGLFCLAGRLCVGDFAGSITNHWCHERPRCLAAPGTEFSVGAVCGHDCLVWVFDGRLLF